MSSSSIPNEFVNETGASIKGQHHIANGFNKFFVNVGPDLAKNIKRENTDIFNYLQNRNECSMFLQPTNMEEVFKTINSCSNKVSTDSEDLSMNIVKQIVKEVVEPFTHICNLSFIHGKFPENMKIAKVIPLYKGGSKNVYTNYRPVSLLSQFSKVLEKLFDVRLQAFVEKSNILSDSQYGFRSNRSTSLALMELIEEICTGIDNKKLTVGVFIDLKKAFDTIDHNILLEKLEFYGIRGVAHSWIKSYLFSRKQYVQVDNSVSELLSIMCGVPQGSVLGPKLFILYINDLCNVSKLLKYVLFCG